MMTKSQEIINRFDNSVISNYGRFDLVISRAYEFEVFDIEGRRYLDMGFGIAVNCLGHCHPELKDCLTQQMESLDHVSNLYYYENQAQLAENISHRLGGGKVFFCNSGAESNEAIIKLARRFGHNEGRYKIITAENSFHGRTLATIAATGQQKVKTGFGPAVEGFSHIPFGDLSAFENSIDEKTAAILIEGVQGEGGLTTASAEYLREIRNICNKENILFLMDGVQCGMFRTGKFQSIQRILDLNSEDQTNWLPDAISMGKSLAGGFPIGALWAGSKTKDILEAGSRGTTYGGNPLACAVSNKVFEIIQRDNLDKNIRDMEILLRKNLESIKSEFSQSILSIRGLGFMTGIVLNPESPIFKSLNGVTPSIYVTKKIQEMGMLVIPAGPHVVRFLPAYNIGPKQIDEAIGILRKSMQHIHE